MPLLTRSRSLLCLTISLSTFTTVLAAPNCVEVSDANDSSWLTGASSSPTYNSTGGIGNSGFISYTTGSFNSGSGGFGEPLSILFRDDNAANPSGDAFVGNWIADGVVSFSLAVRHNHTGSRDLYARFDAGAGAGAGLADNSSLFSIAIPIADSNPPFTSFGTGSFNSVCSNIQNLQIGLYLPANTNFDGLRMDLDNVAVAIRQPTTQGLVGLAFVGSTFASRLWRPLQGQHNLRNDGDQSEKEKTA